MLVFWMKIPFFRSRNVMDMHTLVDKILDSYEELGGINGEGINSFPNRDGRRHRQAEPAVRNRGAG